MGFLMMCPVADWHVSAVDAGAPDVVQRLLPIDVRWWGGTPFSRRRGCGRGASGIGASAGSIGKPGGIIAEFAEHSGGEDQVESGQTVQNLGVGVGGKSGIQRARRGAAQAGKATGSDWALTHPRGAPDHEGAG